MRKKFNNQLTLSEIEKETKKSLRRSLLTTIWLLCWVSFLTFFGVTLWKFYVIHYSTHPFLSYFSLRVHQSNELCIIQSRAKAKCCGAQHKRSFDISILLWLRRTYQTLLICFCSSYSWWWLPRLFFIFYILYGCSPKELQTLWVIYFLPLLLSCLNRRARQTWREAKCEEEKRIREETRGLKVSESFSYRRHFWSD